MLSKKIEEALNRQVEVEARSSQAYLAMASWAENTGLGGTAAFLYRHSDEERMHMLKLIKFINERGGRAVVPALDLPNTGFSSITDIFRTLFEHETMVTEEINGVVDLCLQARAESGVGRQLCSDEPERLREQLAVLSELDSESVDCIVTSPPYFGLPAAPFFWTTTSSMRPYSLASPGPMK